MTGEEKADRYIDEIALGMYNPDAEGVVTIAYIDGLAEGRKEVEKEKCELLGIIQGKDEVIAELKKDKEWLENTDNEQTDLILKLYEQIEKMKCCGNCKYGFANGVGCMQRARGVFCDNKDKWELAE